MIDKHLTIKIAGFSKIKSNKIRTREIFNKDWYLAPELRLRDSDYADIEDGEKVDVFALGIVLFACKMKIFPTFDDFGNIIISMTNWNK